MIDLTEIAREITIDDCYQQEMIDMREDIFGDKTIPIQVVESLVKVIDYSFEDELEHYNNCEKEDKVGHIFPHLHIAFQWINALLEYNYDNQIDRYALIRK